MKALLCLTGSLLIAVSVTIPSANALEVKRTTRTVVEGMCGGGIQSGGGHTGCTICTTKMCTDYDCTKKSCKLVNFIKGRPGSIRTGVNQVGTKSDRAPKSPVNKGSGLKPVSTIGQVGGKGGGMNQGGHRR
jgi:hypothetical protein